MNVAAGTRDDGTSEAGKHVREGKCLLKNDERNGRKITRNRGKSPNERCEQMRCEEKDRLNGRRKSDTVARMRNKRKGERTEAKRKRDVKNTENRREQVPLFERSLALISRRPPYKLPVCHRS